MIDDPTVIRQWRMLMLGSRRHGIVVIDMAREFAVNDRTTRRDLQISTTPAATADPRWPWT